MRYSPAWCLLFILVFFSSVSGEISAQSPPSQQIGLSDGSFLSPSLSFSNEPGMGLFRPALGQMQFAGSSNICNGCFNGETMFSIRGVRGDSTGYWFRITHTDDGIIAPHLQMERNGGMHLTHFLQVSNDFWIGPPHWRHPIYNDGTNDIGAMIIATSDISGWPAAASIVSFGLPSYRPVTGMGVQPSLYQGYGSVVFSAGPGGGQLTGTKVFDVRDDGALQIGTKAFDSLPNSPNGTMYYCPDCVFANSCLGGGTGAFAKRLNNAWRCD